MPSWCGEGREACTSYHHGAFSQTSCLCWWSAGPCHRAERATAFQQFVLCLWCLFSSSRRPEASQLLLYHPWQLHECWKGLKWELKKSDWMDGWDVMHCFCLLFWCWVQQQHAVGLLITLSMGRPSLPASCTMQRCISLPCKCCPKCSPCLHVKQCKRSMFLLSLIAFVHLSWAWDTASGVNQHGWGPQT